MKLARVLVSNEALPANKIGSWPIRTTTFLNRNPSVFTHVLSPNNKLTVSVYSKKRPFITWKKSLRNIQLLHWVARDYVKHLKALSKSHDKLIIVVMDDPHLIEAIGLIKHKLKSEVELIFSFHGFELTLSSKVIKLIDKIVWLSQMGLAANKVKYDYFPNSVVVGNAVESNEFFPLEASEFKQKRKMYGYEENDEIVIWMANDKPRKGFHIFKALVLKLLETTNLKFIIIGTSKTINHTNVKNLGRIDNKNVSEYLKLGNYFIFTTTTVEGFGLSMIEAYKSGNAVIATHKPATPEVLSHLEFTYLVEDYEDIDNWVTCINLARENTNYGKKRITKAIADKIWNYETWEQKFLNAIT